MVERCESCGVEMPSEEDHAGDDAGIPYCSACADHEGELLSRSAVEQKVADRLMAEHDVGDREKALRHVRRKLDEMPAWK
ncbi:MAG: zinc ribbon domain-containing protein [Candidatus Nanohaloarchaea archaeon]|nr:zinc ribbon domain-containing protein [Candidatus Nanohaloarchaea archaeon]